MHGKISFEIFIAGIFLGYLYSKTNSLLLCVLMHVMYNFIVITTPFYVFYRGAGRISLSPLQYVAALLAFQLVCVLIIEIVSGTFAKSAGVSERDSGT
jgi:membrane protease YdiL (CAAX protease family)